MKKSYILWNVFLLISWIVWCKFDFDEQEGEQGSDCEPEGESGQVVKEGQGSGDFLHLGDCHLIRDAVVLYLVDGVAEVAVAVLDRNVTEIDGVARAVDVLVLRDVDGVVVHVALIECVVSDAVNDLKLATGGTSRQH